MEKSSRDNGLRDSNQEQNLIPEVEADQSGLDARMQFGIVDDSMLEVFEPLLLPQVAEALHSGEPITVMGIAKEGVACGALAGYLSGDCFRVISLYVAPDYRRQGGARHMIRELEALIEDEPDIGEVELQFTTAEPDNETLLPFLEAMGFLQESDGGRNIYEFALGDLKPVSLPKVSEDRNNRVCSFSQLPDALLHAAQKRSVALGTPQPEQTLTSKEIERELSYALVRDGRIEAYAAVDHSCCGVLTLCALWIGDSNRATLNTLIKTVLAHAQALYPPQTRIAMQAVNDQSERMIQRLAPQARKVSYMYRQTV